MVLMWPEPSLVHSTEKLWNRPHWRINVDSIALVRPWGAAIKCVWWRRCSPRLRLSRSNLQHLHCHLNRRYMNSLHFCLSETNGGLPLHETHPFGFSRALANYRHLFVAPCLIVSDGSLPAPTVLHTEGRATKNLLSFSRSYAP